MSKKAMFFTLDALLASIVVVSALLLVNSYYVHHEPENNPGYVAEDMLMLLSEITVKDLNNSISRMLILNGTAEGDTPVMEQIGRLWANNQTNLSRQLAQSALEPVMPPAMGVSISMEDQLIFLRNTSTASNIVKTTNFISGIEKTRPVEGFSSRVYLKGFDARSTSEYVYFGGYEGDGNLTKSVVMPNGFNITRISLQTDAGTDFKLYINNNFSGAFPKGSGNSSQMKPDSWDINASYYRYLHKGKNNISIRFERINENFTASGPKFVAGGYLRIDYETTNISELNNKRAGTAKYKFPGIEGFLNLYSSFYIPGNLSSLKLHLHYRSNYTTFINIGNVTVFRGETNNTVKNTTINNSVLKQIFNNSNISYQALSMKTLPLRLGLINVTKGPVPLDLALTTDTSGSMDDDCPLPGCKIKDAQNASKQLIDEVLNNPLPEIGLISYDTTTNFDENHQLSRNSSSLKSTIDDYTAGGGTCTCCGINSASELLTTGNYHTALPRSTGGWRYNHDDLSSPPSGWNELSYDDSSWPTGTTVFRNNYWNLGSPRTYVNKYEGDYYFRKTFAVDNASQVLNATIKILSDDGADVYLNGNLVDNNYGETSESADYWNRQVTVPGSHLQEGQNILAARLYNGDWCFGGWFCWTSNIAFNAEIDLILEKNETRERQKSMIVMSDGQATYECSEQGVTGDLDNDGSSDRPSDDAVQAACDAYQDHGIIVHAVGFGDNADEQSLKAIAECGHGSYYSSDNVEDLVESYIDIFQEMIEYTRTQASNATNLQPARLFSDSYIEYNYTPLSNSDAYGRIPITTQTNTFGEMPGNKSEGQLYLPDDVELLSAKVTSYSEDKWTHTVYINNSQGFNTVYNLSSFGNDFHFLGDAFTVNIPVNSFRYDENNTIGVKTYLENISAGSMSNRVIYTVLLDNSVDYTPVLPKNTGCIWHIKFYDNSSEQVKIPLSYNGSSKCFYSNATYENDNSNHYGTYQLLSKLDFNKDGLLDVKVGPENLKTDSMSVSKVPTMWGPSTMEVRVWK